MRKPPFRRCLSLVLSLAMALSLGLTARAAEADGLCEHHPDHTTDCGYEATGECTHECTADSGCITVKCSHTHVGTCYDAEGTLICTHVCTDTPACYTPVIECLHIEHGSCGHSEGKDCDFAVNGCPECKAIAEAVTLKGTDVVLPDGTEYTYTGEEIKPQVTVMVDRLVLVENEHYTVSYANNIGVGTGNVTVTGIIEAGYTGTVTIPFSILKAPGTPEFTLVEIKGTDVTIDGTEFAYTGEAIEPAITVTVGGTLLTAGRDYSVTYTNNVEPGTATVTVKGIATASETLGYTGEVSIDFTILKAQEPETPSEPETPTEPETPSQPEYTLVEIKGTDVVIEGTEFAYTGEAVEPAITVTVGGAVLTAGRDYSVTYTNNVEPGTATVTVKGIATASETLGYTGEVSIDFTILKAQEPETPSEPEKPTEPETPSEPEKPTEPETPSEPEEETQPETQPVDYKITKGSGSKWRQDSGKSLSFTVNADTDDITAIRIDGKKLNAKHYTLGKNGIVTLKNSYLEDLDIGTYRITVEFEDGDAEGKFTVAKAVDDSNPKTGDSIMLWVGLMTLSLLGGAALLIFGRKKFFK